MGPDWMGHEQSTMDYSVTHLELHFGVPCIREPSDHGYVSGRDSLWKEG